MYSYSSVLNLFLVGIVLTCCSIAFLIFATPTDSTYLRSTRQVSPRIVDPATVNTVKTYVSMTCKDGSAALLNDEYCDCMTGEDEPETSACSYFLPKQSVFVCDGHKHLFYSRLNDGVVDCKDHSDETALR